MHPIIVKVVGGTLVFCFAVEQIKGQTEQHVESNPTVPQPQQVRLAPIESTHSGNIQAFQWQ